MLPLFDAKSLSNQYANQGVQCKHTSSATDRTASTFFWKIVFQRHCFDLYVFQMNFTLFLWKCQWKANIQEVCK